MTTGQWIEKWLSIYITPRVRPYTNMLYTRLLTNYAIPAIGRIPLAKLTEFDIQAIIFGKLKNKYRSAEVFRILMIAIMKKAVKCRLLKYSPATDLELPPKPPKKKFCKPTAEDWKKLIEYKTKTNTYYCWRWIMLTEYVTGARIGELTALRWEDLHLEKDSSGHITSGTLHIQHAFYLGEKEADNHFPICLGSTKTASGNRVLPLPLYYCQEIQRYRKIQLEHRLLVPNWQEKGFMFTTWDGNPIRPGSLSSCFNYIRNKLGMGFTFHMLRHDMASRMKNSSRFDMKDIQEQLGHSSINITMDIYTHIDEDTQQRKVSAWLEEDLTNLMGVPENNKNIK